MDMPQASPIERAQWIALIETLPARASLAGLFLIVDIRRGITAQDEQLIEWAAAAGWQVHVLLTKSDKLNQRERAAALKAAQSALARGHDGRRCSQPTTKPACSLRRSA